MPPPPKKSKGPPPRKPTLLPKGQFCKVVATAFGFEIVTLRTELVVGRRLDKGKGNYPNCASEKIKMLDEAKASMLEWDKFMEANAK